MSRADRLATLFGRGATAPTATTAPPPVYVRIPWPEDELEEDPAAPAAPELNGHALNGHAITPKEIYSHGPGTVSAPGGTPRDLFRGSLLLVHDNYLPRTGRLKVAAWGVWLDLYHEAKLLGLNRRLPHLEMALRSSPTIDGWGQLRLVEALRGEVKPETMPPSGYLGAGAPQQPATPTTVVVTNGQAAEQPKKRGLLGRIRG